MRIRETHKHDSDSYIPGDYYLVCDVCGLDFRRSDMKERWDKAWVCHNDWEPRNEQESVRGIPEKINVPVARPVPANNNLISSWGESSTYETFTSDVSRITSAVNSSGTGSARTNDTGVVDGTQYNICAILTLNSGQAPTIITGSASAADGATLGTLDESNGVNNINFTAANSKTYLYIINTSDADWELTITLIPIVTQDGL
jgi:hypothetical protein